VALRNDVEAAGAPSEHAADVDVPDGTPIEVRLDESLSSRVARPEDRVTASVAESVRVDGRLAIPAGATIEGVVQSVEPARRPAHGGSLDLSFDTLAVAGRRTRMSARVVSVEEDSLDKSKAGLGALVGGVLGALVEGKKGAIVGALVGGTGAVVATRGDDVELPAGTRLTLRLDRPVRVSRR
jgi:outer membrane lipoprotein SlyB